MPYVNRERGNVTIQSLEAGKRKSKGRSNSSFFASPTATTEVRELANLNAIANENITLSGLQTIDGISLNANEKVGAFNQTLASEIGVYTVSGGAWVLDTSVTTLMPIFCNNGTNYKNTYWYFNSNNDIVSDRDFWLGQTTNNVQTELFYYGFDNKVYTIPDNSSKQINLIIECNNTDFDISYTFTIFASIANNSTTHSIIDNTQIVTILNSSNPTSNEPEIVLSADANGVHVLATGVTGETINWRAYANI